MTRLTRRFVQPPGQESEAQDAAEAGRVRQEGQDGAAPRRVSGGRGGRVEPGFSATVLRLGVWRFS